MAILNHLYQTSMMNMKKSEEHDMEDPNTFCNPIEWLDEAEKGLKKWVDEDYWRKDGEGGKNRWVDKE